MLIYVEQLKGGQTRQNGGQRGSKANLWMWTKYYDWVFVQWRGRWDHLWERKLPRFQQYLRCEAALILKSEESVGYFYKYTLESHKQRDSGKQQLQWKKKKVWVPSGANVGHEATDSQCHRRLPLPPLHTGYEQFPAGFDAPKFPKTVNAGTFLKITYREKWSYRK